MKIRLMSSFLLLYCTLLTLSPAWAAFDSKQLSNDKPLAITRITPAGEDVSQTRQIVFQFNQAVVPVGNMARPAAEIPIQIKPALECEWRWLNTSALACQLGSANSLQLATRYQIIVSPGIKTEAGKTLENPIKHQFITQRPTVRYTDFNTWRAPSMPEIRVSFNQAVTKQSVADHLFFQKKNGQRIAANVFLVSSDRAEKVTDSSTRRVWMVMPAGLMPLDSEVQLSIEPGLQSALGPEQGIEKRSVVNFHTFPQFRFLGVRCETLDNQTITVQPGAGLNTTQRCDPQQRVSLVFSSPVLPSVIRNNIILKPDLAGGRTDYNPWDRSRDYSQLSSRHHENETYEIHLPELLQAYESYQLQASNLNFRDEFGRPLVSPINIRFLTDNRAPSRMFEHQFSVLETGVDSELPIYVTNLQQLTIHYDRFIAAKGWQAGLNAVVKPPAVKNVSMKIPLEVRRLLGKDADSGVVVGEFHPLPEVDNDDYNRANWFFSQVTPFYVQAKVGHFNTLVWVMDFATGQPVKGVTISLFRSTYDQLAQPHKVEASGVTDANGVAMLPGAVDFDPKLDILTSYNDKNPRFFLQATQDQAVALLPLNYDFQVSMYELTDGDYSLYPSTRSQYGHIQTWGTTAQGVYKVGDQVQYKLFVRNQDNRRFVPAPQKSYTLIVTDPMGNTVHEVKAVQLSEFGGLAGEFEIPKTAPVGWYTFNLSADFVDRQWQPMKVLVSDFTPSPFRVQTTLNGKLFKQGQTVSVETSAQLHAGGPYVNANTRITAMLDQKPFRPQTTVARGFQFDTHTEDSYDETVFQTEAKVNEQGELQTTFTLNDSAVLYGQLRVESAVQDDRGKRVAASSSANYVGRDRFVGLKQADWVESAQEAAQMYVLVVDALGNPVSQTGVQVLIERRETKAARVKGAGNAYLTHFEHEWVNAGRCDLQSLQQVVTCDYTPSKAGNYRLTATIKDTKGRTHQTEAYQWVSGADSVIWETNEGNSLTLLPEQESYKVGDTARYLVKNPYPGAQALITVERFGVLEQRLTTLAESIEIIEVPVLADYEPGFFVSVTVMSPRQNQPLTEAGVDLGKPAFRMGYVRTMVSDPYKEITVKIASDKDVYRPQETVTLNLHAQPTTELAITEPVELTIAVLDEAVFDLLQQGRDYFDPYRGFYALDRLDLNNYSLLMRLVGRQKFEKKGASAGGDGGLGPNMRALFKFVSYWNSGLKTDADGKATVSFQVPDNLTGWRVLAIAMTPSDRMGLGDSNFKVNLPLEVRPVMPNQVTSGDHFRAGVSVMNRTDQARDITVQLTASGAALETTNGQSVSVTETVTTQPYQRTLIWLPVQTTQAGQITFTAQASSETLSDGLTHNVPVKARRALQTAATYGTTTAEQITESIAFPANSEPAVGGLSVIASPTVIGEVEGAFAYMRDYPYGCWEQRLSKGVMAAHYDQLKPYLPADFTWTDSTHYLPRMLSEAQNYQAANGGMAYYIPTDQRVSPYLSAYTALAFHWLRQQGHDIPAKVENNLHTYLSTLLRRDVLPSFYSKGMAASVRAVALAALAMREKITRADLQRYTPHLPQMDLFGKAAFLQAAVKVPQTDALRQQVVQDILGHANQSGGKISFSETLDDSYKHILSSSIRTQCAILSSFVAYDELANDGLVSDIPFKLMRAITAARKGRGQWQNTQENMFCMNALIEYARVYEAAQPAMTVSVLLDEQALPMVATESATPATTAQFSQFTDSAATFRYDMIATDPGRKAKMTLNREGEGRVYYGVRLAYAIDAEQAEAVNAGIEIKREYHVERAGKWELLTSPMQLQSGDLVRVDLYLSLPDARYFVVVDDPVPGGLEPVNRELATSSQVDADKASGQYGGGSLWYQQDDWHAYDFSFWSFYHKELRHHAVRFYSDYLAGGNYHLSYTAQAIAPGTFLVMPAKVEEMYEPDIYGLSQPARLVIERTAE